jgi:hypothetical protein
VVHGCDQHDDLGARQYWCLMVMVHGCDHHGGRGAGW